MFVQLEELPQDLAKLAIMTQVIVKVEQSSIRH
jgi:hypothetical protein